MNLALFLERAGRDDPRRPALGFGARVLRDYGDMAGRVARLAGALRSGGLNPGDRVAIVAKNSPNYVEVLYAIWHAGLAAVPANAKLHGAELGYILEQSGARVCFVSAGHSMSRFTIVGAANIDVPGQARNSEKISSGSKPPDSGTTLTPRRVT